MRWFHWSCMFASVRDPYHTTLVMRVRSSKLAQRYSLALWSQICDRFWRCDVGLPPKHSSVMICLSRCLFALTVFCFWVCSDSIAFMLWSFILYRSDSGYASALQNILFWRIHLFDSGSLAILRFCVSDLVFLIEFIWALVDLIKNLPVEKPRGKNTFRV